MEHIIENSINYLLKPLSGFRTLHHKIVQHNLLYPKDVTFLNPYQVFFDWLLDVLTEGSILCLIYTTFLGWQGFQQTMLLVLSLGMIKWSVIDIIKKIKEAIMEKG